ncbi:unnamed protein product, partial [Symbiodinium sp. KB8]
HKWLELTANLLEVSGNEPIRSREVEPMEKLDLHMRPVWTLSFQVDGGKDGVHNRLREYFRLSDHNVLMFAGHRFFVGVEGQYQFLVAVTCFILDTAIYHDGGVHASHYSSSFVIISIVFIVINPTQPISINPMSSKSTSLTPHKH